MPWYGWYSEKQRKLYGRAVYSNKAGESVFVTQVHSDAHYKHPFTDSKYLGRLTHFHHVDERHATKARRKEPDPLVPTGLTYDHSGKIGGWCLILN
jgi:hypothetical protein